MATTAAFDQVCERLEQGTGLDRIQCRGTLRLVLKEAGLDPSQIQPREMAAVLERLLPGALASRGVNDVKTLCASISGAIASIPTAAQPETPEAIFRRLAG